MTRARDVANLIGSGNYSSTTFTATAGQTAFTISHTQGFIQVFMNGLLLDETVDYTSNGSAVTLTSGAAAGDEIEVVAYNTFSVGDALPKSGGAMTGALDMNGAEIVLDADGDTSITSDTDDRIDIKVAGTDSVHIKPTAAHGTGIGIGTNAPLRQLHISNTSANSEIAFTAGTSGVSSILFGDGLTGTDVYKGYLQYNHAQDKMLIATAAGSSINIDSSGRVTTPYQPGFQADGNFGWRNYSSYTVVPNWRVTQTGQFNNGNHFNHNTGVFTCPVAGRYLINMTAWVNNSGRVDHYTRVGLNGNYWGDNLIGYHNDDTAYPDNNISATYIMNASANDTIDWRHLGDIYGYHSSWSIILLA